MQFGLWEDFSEQALKNKAHRLSVPLHNNQKEAENSLTEVD